MKDHLLIIGDYPPNRNQQDDGRVRIIKVRENENKRNRVQVVSNLHKVYS